MLRLSAKIFFILLFGVSISTAQSPSTGLYSQYASGVAPGYWPSQGSGLAITLSSGTVVCSGSTVTYAGGTLSLTASSTNYVYLNTASSCAPAVSTTAFPTSSIAIAIVTTSATAVTSLSDVRTPAMTYAVNPTSTSRGVVLNFGADSIPNATGTGAKAIQHYSTFQTNYPCFSNGYIAPNAGGANWCTQVSETWTNNFFSPGISQHRSGTDTKGAVGDFMDEYLYMFGRGGATAPTDEGWKAKAMNLTEITSPITGAVTTGGTGAALVKIGCGNGCTNAPGAGQYLTEESSTPINSYLTAPLAVISGGPPGVVMPSKIPVAETVTPSTAWGTIIADVTPPNPVDYDDSSTWSNTSFSVNMNATTPSGVPSGTPIWACVGSGIYERFLASPTRAEMQGAATVTVASMGSNQTNGTYTISADPVSGVTTPAQISITISEGGITQAYILDPGGPYTSAPTFTISEGGTPGSVTATVGPTQLFSAKMLHRHTAPGHGPGSFNNGWIMFGGVCNNYNALDFAANRIGAMHYPQPILGAIDSHTLIGNYYYQGYDRGFVQGNVDLTYLAASNSELSSITRTSNHVTLNVNTSSYLGGQSSFLGNTIYISGATNTSLNGLCTGTQVVLATGTLQCSQTGADITTPDTTATVTVCPQTDPATCTGSFGNSNYERVSITEIVDVRDTTQVGAYTDFTTAPPTFHPTQQLNGTFHLPPNPGAWTPAETVNMYNHPTLRFLAEGSNSVIQNPLASLADGYSATYAGAAVNGTWAGSTIANGNPATMYKGFGGTTTAPIGYRVNGLHQNSFSSQYAPPPYGSAILVGCPITGCASSTYPSFNVWTIQGNGQGWFTQWTPSTDTLDDAIWTYPTGRSDIVRSPSAGINIKTTVGSNTSNFSSLGANFMMDKPLIVQGSNVCLATGANCPTVSVSLTTTSATSDIITAMGMTSSGHCSLGATNASAASNIANTYISGKAANQVTVTHAGISGMTYDIVCTIN